MVDSAMFDMHTSAGHSLAIVQALPLDEHLLAAAAHSHNTPHLQRQGAALPAYPDCSAACHLEAVPYGPRLTVHTLGVVLDGSERTSDQAAWTSGSTCSAPRCLLWKPLTRSLDRRRTVVAPT